MYLIDQLAALSVEPLGLVILFLAMLLFFLLWRAQRANALNWTDMITGPNTNKVSLTKFLQLVGGITGTWVIVYLTLKGSIASELFFTYLAYVGAIQGWSKFVSFKYGSGAQTNSDPTPPPVVRAPKIPEKL